MPLRCVVFHNDERISEKVFDQDLVRIGRLDSAHLQLRDLARMHAFFERRDDGSWRVVNLDSSLGTRINGAVVDRYAEMGHAGRIDLGPWTVLYEVTPESAAATDTSPAEDPTHHRQMMEAIVAEMERRGLRDPARVARKSLALWERFSDVRKRTVLRLGVQALRHGRDHDEKVRRQHVAGMLRLGPEGISAIYDLTPEEALAHARLTLHAISQASASIHMIGQLDLCRTVREAPHEDPEAREGLEHFEAGHAQLVNLLEEEMVHGVSVLTACLSRAGGHTLTHRERVELKKAFAQIKDAAGGSSEATST